MSANSTCALDYDPAKTATIQLSYAAYFCVKPIMLIFDLFGHLLCFRAFYKQSKRQGVYSFQLFDSMAKATDSLLAFSHLVCSKMLSGMAYDGVAWFQQSYSFMWYSAHLSLPFSDMTMTMKLFISLAMTMDRVIGIAMPTRYKQMNRRLWELGSVSLSILISVSASVFVCFYYELVLLGDRYKIVANQDFIASTGAKILSHFRNAVWIAGLISLILAGFSLVYLFQSRHKKAANLTSGQADDAKLKRKKASEKTLFILTCYHSFQAMNEVSILIAHTFMAFKLGFAECENKFFSPLRHIEIVLINASDFYVLLFLNKSFRKIISDGLKKDQVVPISSQASNQSRNRNMIAQGHA